MYQNLTLHVHPVLVRRRASADFFALFLALVSFVLEPNLDLKNILDILFNDLCFRLGFVFL